MRRLKGLIFGVMTILAGLAGAAAPAYLPPDKEPKLPYVDWKLLPPPK